MNATTALQRPQARHVGTALFLYAATAAVSMLLGAPRPATFGSALASSAATAAGTLAMALYLVRWTPYPRWSFLGAAAVMAVGALVGPFVTPDPAAWAEGVRPMLWMSPWFFMVMAWVPPTARRTWCAPDAPWAWALLIGTAALLTLICWGTAFLARHL